MSSLKHSGDSSAVGDDDEKYRLDRQAITDSFLSAIESLDADKVEMLLKSDFEIDYPDIVHTLVLHTAVKLIEVGANSWKDEPTVDKHLNPLYKSETLLRIVQDLLESGRFNVNSLNESSETTLHFAVKCCKCRIFHCDEYKRLVNTIIELLFKNSSNINAKTSTGETPLIMASERGCSHIVKSLLDWRDELGAVVDLNARDIYGETALIKAAKLAHVDVVDSLLKHGCLDKFQDHRGFYALHAVIFGHHLIDDAWNDFLASIGINVSEKTLGLFDRYDNQFNRLGERILKNLNRNDDIQKIVRMLVTSGRADVNLKDFRGNTVLDLAVKSKLRISQETIEMIMKCGGSFCASENGHPQNSENTFRNVDNFGKTPLHRLSVVLPEMASLQKGEIFDSPYLLSSSSYKEIFESMAVAKDHRGRTALHYAVLPRFGALDDDDGVLLQNILKLKCIVNERDNYGRTPLHYCQRKDINESLVEQGADEYIPDIDGKTPQDFKQLRWEARNRCNLPLDATHVLNFVDDEELRELNGDNSKLEEHLHMRELDAEMIWKDSNYAYRDHFSTTMCDKVRQFINRLSYKIGEKHPRFECQPVLIGSAEEGTKVGSPDEFDFNFILTKLSELCEVIPSPEAPSGYVHLKRKSYNDEDWHANQDFNNAENYDMFFNNGGFLLTSEIASRFRIQYLEILSEPEFWDGEDVFEWETCSEIGMVNFKMERLSNGPRVANDFRPSTHPCSSIRLKLNRPINGRYMFTPISLDIVPCIKINDFWPGEALSSDKLKCGGCHLVFDQPQRRYPWVPFSDPFARISFAPAESRMIKECSAVARAAYMVVKHLLCYKPKLTYVLKNCLLYCIEALKDCTSNSLLYEDINPTELRFFVERLMLCFHDFYLKDFLPCYMMQSFHLPIEGHLKSKHDKLLHDSKFRYTLFACKLYRLVCITKSEVDDCIPTPQPLNENFDREELLRKLSMDNK